MQNSVYLYVHLGIYMFAFVIGMKAYIERYNRAPTQSALLLNVIFSMILLFWTIYMTAQLP